MTISNTPFTPSAQNAGINYYSEVVGVSTACVTPLEIWTYHQSVGAAFAREQEKYEYDVGSENCGQGTMGQINTNIQKFFIFLKGIKKYEQLYIQGTINKVANLQSNIKKTARALAGIIRIIIQRTRNWILAEIKDMVTNVIENFLTPLMKQIKKATMEQIIDQIFCAFDRIIDSLIDMVGDFLYSLIGQVVNAPFCAAERWANALINRVVTDIDKALAPLFAQINDLLGGIAKVAGSVMKVVNTILGFEGFFCKTPDCPALTKFAASPWGGPTKTMTDNFNKFEFLPASTSTDITKSTTEWLDTVGFGTGTAATSPGDCYTGTFECGIPQIVLFGGGGSGAVAQAVVNNIEQVIGSNVLSGGSGYTAPPFVSIEDPAGCGSNATGAAVINDEGEVIDVIITNPGTGYDDTYNGGAPVISSFNGSPNPMVLGGSVTLSWNVSNADWVGLSEPGLTGLPLNGSASIIIKETDVITPPGATSSSKKFTITAKKNHQKSEEQITTRDFIVSTLKSGTPDPEAPNTLPPQIDSFSGEPTVLQRGSLLTLSWQTENTSSLSLSGSYEWNNATYKTEEGNFPTLPGDGSISFVIPSHDNEGGVQFPTGSDNVVRKYTLTAINKNAPVNSTGAVNTISKTVNVKIEKIAGSLGPGIGTTTTGGVTTPGGTGIGTTTVTIGVGTVTPVGAGTTLTTGTGVGTTIGTTGAGTTFGNTGSASGTGNNNAVAVISSVSIISTGIGYTSGATATVTNGGGGSSTNAAIGSGDNGAALNIVTNPLGQIVDVKLLSSGYGFTKIPRIKINSKTGAGADFRANLKFIPVSQFLEDQSLQTIDPNKLVQVVDCPDKPLTVKIL